jgi:hypothetical protein
MGISQRHGMCASPIRQPNDTAGLVVHAEILANRGE